MLLGRKPLAAPLLRPIRAVSVSGRAVLRPPACRRGSGIRISRLNHDLADHLHCAVEDAEEGVDPGLLEGIDREARIGAPAFEVPVGVVHIDAVHEGLGEFPDPAAAHGAPVPFFPPLRAGGMTATSPTSSMPR